TQGIGDLRLDFTRQQILRNFHLKSLAMKHLVENRLIHLGGGIGLGGSGWSGGGAGLLGFAGVLLSRRRTGAVGRKILARNPDRRTAGLAVTRCFDKRPLA